MSKSDTLKKIIKYIGSFFSFSKIVVIFNIAYLVYFTEKCFSQYELFGSFPSELAVPVYSVFGGELTLTALINIFKRKYDSTTDIKEYKTEFKRENISEMNNGDDRFG